MQLRFNPKLATIEPSAIRTMHERKLATSVDLGMGQPSLLPDAEPFARATAWVRANGCPYAPNAGLPELRERIAHIYGGRFCNGLDNVCVTNGSQEGLYLCIKTLLEPAKDEVLITEPSYPSYWRACDLEGVRHSRVALSAADGFAVRAESILEALTPQTRLIILGSPANPTGAVMDCEQVESLARQLLDRPGPPVYLLIDEVYRELTFTRAPYTSFMEYYPRTIAVQSLSKSCALTGLRLGFLFGPAGFIEAATRAHALMMMSVNMFAQRVALEIVTQDGSLRAHYPWYERQREVLLQAVTKNDLQIIEPQGAFYALLALPPTLSDSQVAADRLLAEADVVTIPGSVFGRASNAYLRLTWAAPEETLTEGLARIAQFLAKS